MSTNNSNDDITSDAPSKKQKTGPSDPELSSEAQRAEAPSQNARKNDVILTFSMDQFPMQFQLLRHNTLRDLVRIAFKVCDPRGNGDTENSHMWRIKVVGTGKSYLEGMDSHSQRPRPAILDDVLSKNVETDTFVKGDKLQLHYDYGSSTNHLIRLVAIEDFPANDPSVQPSDFPRRKVVPGIAHEQFVTADGDNLKEAFPNMQKYAFEAYDRKPLLNCFKAGRKNVHAFFEVGGRMILLPEKPSSLSHLFAMLDKGASIPKQYGVSWQSTVILPQNFKKYKKWFEDLEPGFCDCKLVGEPSRSEKDWDKIFPKTAAFAGFRKDKQIKQKGWIRYCKGVLQLVVGAGSPNVTHSAMKGTAFAGRDCHAPASGDTILFRVDENFDSIHDLFCKVEGLLRTLK